MPAEICFPFLDDFEKVIDLCVLIVQLTISRNAIVVRRFLSFGDLKPFPLFVTHIWRFDGTNQIGIRLFEFSRKPISIGGKDGAGLHEFGVNLYSLVFDHDKHIIGCNSL